MKSIFILLVLLPTTTQAHEPVSPQEVQQYRYQQNQLNKQKLIKCLNKTLLKNGKVESSLKTTIDGGLIFDEKDFGLNNEIVEEVIALYREKGWNASAEKGHYNTVRCYTEILGNFRIGEGYGFTIYK